MSLRTILLGDGGPGASLGTLLSFGLGLALISAGAVSLAEGLRREPEPVGCDALAAQVPGRWLAPSGCRFDLAHAVAEDGGRWLAPLAPSSPSPDGGALVLAELEPELVVLARLRPDAGAPARLQGHLERRGSSLVLAPGRPRPEGRSLVAFFLGTAVLVWALVPVGRRWLLAREH